MHVIFMRRDSYGYSHSNVQVPSSLRVTYFTVITLSGICDDEIHVHAP